MGAEQSSCSISATITTVFSGGKDGKPKLCVGKKKMSREKTNPPPLPTIKLLLNGSISQPSLKENSGVYSMSVESQDTLHFIFLHLLLLCIMLSLGSHTSSAPSLLRTRS